MSDVLNERRLRSEKMVYGYFRTHSHTSIQIPNDIKRLCRKYYHIEELFDVNKMHASIEITNSGSTATRIMNIDGCYRNVYGSIGVDSKHPRKYQWNIAITGSGPFIGLASNPDIDSDRHSFDYAYSTWMGTKHRFHHYEKYGDSAPTGSSLTVIADFKKREICFIVNGKDQGVAFEDIVIGPIYYLAVSLYDKGQSATIDDFNCIG